MNIRERKRREREREKREREAGERNIKLKTQYPVQGPVVQSIVSLTSSLRVQVVKCFAILQPNTLKFFVEKMRKAFAMQKLLIFFSTKILAYLRY